MKQVEHSAALRKLMADHGIRQKDLAGELGITAVGVSKTLAADTVTPATYHRYKEAILSIAIRNVRRSCDELPEVITINGVRYRRERE